MIETAVGLAAGGAVMGSLPFPQASVDTLRKNANSNSGFMRTSHAGCAQTRFANLSVRLASQRRAKRMKTSIFHAGYSQSGQYSHHPFDLVDVVSTPS